ncbi:MAG: SUMF1/EgtB/PvdO family nonheme iron enzyme [Gammaproteobacteria bacterium]
MTTPGTLQQLGSLQTMVRALAEETDETTFRTQYHPDLSPLGWHLGHCVYAECYWLYEAVSGNRELTAAIENLYIPANSPKQERGAKLPQRERLLEWAEQVQQHNLLHLKQLTSPAADHHLHADEYLQHFLIQHRCQHVETMIMVLHQKALHDTVAPFSVEKPLVCAPVTRNALRIPDGYYKVGGQPPLAYDNELPQQRVKIDSFHIARCPVSNAEFLAFMEADGYLQEDSWGSKGWAWRQQTLAAHPEHWRRDGNRNWYGIGLRGAYELIPDEPVSGISYFEAEAYAHWAGGKLPHEYQWETASRLELIEQTGRVWEWCRNTFHPYEGFTPFPYEDYSQPWFDGAHYTLRGGSIHTQPQVRRHSFRNFYTPDKRHVFAGLRLVFN